ncbi:MAG: PorT family protein [Melioribacteraceae bacterium]|nr:PorT family protein [Melioribacteraceae bacterium]
MSLLYKCLQISLFSLIFLLSSISAQDTTSNVQYNPRFGIQFQIDKNLSLKNYNGKIISGKYRVTDRLMLGVGISFRAEKYIHDYKRIVLDESDSTMNYVEKKSSSVILEPHLFYYFNQEKNISFYFGGGPFIKFYFSHSFNNTIRKQSYGLDLIIGIEWKLTSKLSISSEYQSRIGYEWKKFKGYAYDGYKHDDESNSISIDSDNIRLGLSVYF